MIGACVAWLALALPTAAAQDEGTVDRLVEVVAEVGPVGDEALCTGPPSPGSRASRRGRGRPNTVRTDAQRAAERAGGGRAARHRDRILHSAGEGLWITHVFDGGPGRRRACISMISWWVGGWS